MRIQKLLATSAATAILATALVSCSEAQDAADKAKAKASEAAAAKAAEALESGKAKASEKAGEMIEQAKQGKAGALVNDVMAKLSPEQQDKLQGVDAVALGAEGELTEDADSLTVAEFFAARQQAAANGGEDLSALEALAGPRVFKRSTRYVTRNSGKDLPFVVSVVSSEAGAVNACVGPQGKRARTLTVTDGKVTKNVAGQHTCA